MTGARVVNRLAKAFLATGILLLAFVAYQLWGTALYEHSAQGRLRSELRHTLHTKGTLPAAPHGTTPNPTSAQVLSAQVAPPSADPAAGQPVGLLSIPAIGMADAAIVEGTGEGQLQQGPGHYQGTPLPGEAGNVGIAGHRTTYGAPFYSLDALHQGDAIDVETAQGLFQYRVTGTEVVDPSNVAVLDPTQLPELTLTTCNPRYSASQRLVVQALLTASVVNGSFKPTPAPSSASRPSRLGGVGCGGWQSTAGCNVVGGIVGAVLWGLGAVLLAVGARLAWRRLAGSPRWLGILGLVGAVACLLVCFQHVSLALPASF